MLLWATFHPLHPPAAEFALRKLMFLKAARHAYFQKSKQMRTVFEAQKLLNKVLIKLRKPKPLRNASVSGRKRTCLSDLMRNRDERCAFPG